MIENVSYQSNQKHIIAYHTYNEDISTEL